MAEISPNNNDDVSSYINKFGNRYDNAFVVDSNVFDTTAQDQYVQFNSLAIYGEFSNDILAQLKQILQNGIYIFGTATV